VIVFAIKSSHKRGMGHLYRSIRISKSLKFKKIIFLINNHKKSLQILKDNKIFFKVINYNKKDWIDEIQKKFKINTWINDRLNTSVAENFKLYKKVKLINFDDLGEGARLAHVNICPLIFKKNIQGKKILQGIKYLPIEKIKRKYIRKRTKIKNILISIGATDNRNINLKLLKNLNFERFKFTFINGPGQKNLFISKNKNFIIKKNVKNIYDEFYKNDLLICGGGMTPFEAASSGLPAIIIAAEKFEIDVGRELSKLGIASYAGYYKDLNYKKINFNLDIKNFSKHCLKIIDTKGLDRILKIIKDDTK